MVFRKPSEIISDGKDNALHQFWQDKGAVGPQAVGSNKEGRDINELLHPADQVFKDIGGAATNNVVEGNFGQK